MMRIPSMITAATASLLVGASAQAVVVIYDDAPQNGWTLQGWWTYEQNQHVYEGTSAIGALGLDANTVGNGSHSFAGEHVVQEGDVLTFYMNTQIDLEGWVQGYIIAVRLNGGNTEMQRQVDDYYVDGVLGGTLTPENDVQQDGNNANWRINIDGDSSTWEKVEYDMTQLGIGTVVNSIRILQHHQGNETATFGTWVSNGEPRRYNSYTVVDNISIVPEPASLALLSIGGLALAARRRRVAQA